LRGFGNRQWVALRARFFDTWTNTVVSTGNWVYRRVNPLQGTTFGGGPDAPAVGITWDQYWLGGQYFEYPDLKWSNRTIIDVAWRNSRTGRWKIVSLRPDWMTARIDFLSGPQKNATC